MKVVLASGNRGKLGELQTLLAPLGLTLLSQAELDIAGAAETGTTFVENAILKARHVCELSGQASIADDSGLVVTALNGEPGVYSARFAGPDANDTANNRKLLATMTNVAERRAYFFCCMVYMRSASDPAPIVAYGSWQGEILTVEQGSGGFGYDPIFLDSASNMSAAELPADMKNKVSHRGKAAAVLLENIRKELANVA